MSESLTSRQANVYQYLIDYIEEHPYPPSIREMAAHFQVSVKASHDHIKALERKGFIRYTARQSRSIEIINQNNEKNLGVSSSNYNDEVIQLPILGLVAAGYPILAEENSDGYLPVSASLLKGKGEHFVLKVEGESMINAGIMDGDYAIIESSPTAINGEIVVARTSEGSVTIKRFFKDNNRFRLEAENPKYPAIYASKIVILGRLKIIIRHY